MKPIDEMGTCADRPDRDQIFEASTSHQAILRLPAVINLTGLSRSSLYAMTNRGDFPHSVKLGIRSVGWLRTDIEKWIEGRIRLSHGYSQGGRS